jgi:hypothetical protein
MRKSIPKIAFVLTLIGLSQYSQGSIKILDYVLAGMIALIALVLLLENISSKPTWKSIVSSADQFDLTYAAFGIGMIAFSFKFTNNGWIFVPLFAAGGLFTGFGSGELIGTGFSGLIKSNAKISIILGFLFLVAGVAWLIVRWDSIVESPSSRTPFPIFLILLGIEVVYFSFRKWRKSLATGKK